MRETEIVITYNNMNTDEIKKQLLHNIEKACDDKNMLQRMLTAIEEIVATFGNSPEIYYEKVGRNIKMNLNVPLRARAS